MLSIFFKAFINLSKNFISNSIQKALGINMMSINQQITLAVLSKIGLEMKIIGIILLFI